MQERNGVPYDAEVEYIENTGGSFIDTLFYPNQDTSVDIGFTTPSPRLSYDGIGLFETRQGYCNRDFAIRWFYNTNGIQYRYGNHAPNAANGYPGNGVYHEISTKKKLLYFDGELVITANNNTFTSPRTLYVPAFVQGTDAPGSNNEFKYKLHYLKIYDNDSLVRDFIPVRIGSEGCLYDAVTHAVFYNMGDSAFVVGPDK